MTPETKEPAPLKVLMVDDDVLMHRLLQHHFARAGYQMLSATNGGEALQLAARELPGLIIMDIMMSGVDGLTVLRELKKLKDTSGIPVIVITANPHPASRKESEVAGAATFLTKPFSPAELLATVRRLLPHA